MLRLAILILLINSSFAQKSYSGAQLLRLKNFTNSTALDILTENYAGSVWKYSKNSLDISFEEQNLNKVKDYINYLGSEFEIIIENVQEIIDNSTPNRTQRSTTMNWKSYHSYDTIKNFIYSLQKTHPKIVKAFKIGTSVNNNNLLLLRISNNVANNKAIWIDGGIHAREWVSPASVTYIANYLVTNWKSLPKYLKNKTWYIMPVMNPDGYIYSHSTDRLWRKNRRKFKNNNCIGVDLNRNFNVNWNSKTQSTNVCSETFRGATAFSEPESNAVKSFLQKHNVLLKAYLTYHSYGQYIIWPYGFTYAGTAPNAKRMQNVAKIAASNIKSKTGMSYTTGRDTILGLISGASDDWVKKVLNVPYTYTIELRDTGKYGFILPANEIIPTAKEALEVARVVANAI